MFSKRFPLFLQSFAFPASRQEKSQSAEIIKLFLHYSSSRMELEEGNRVKDPDLVGRLFLHSLTKLYVPLFLCSTFTSLLDGWKELEMD